MGDSLTHRFSLEGVSCDWYRSAKSALDAMQKREYAAVISDIRLPDLSGEALFNSLLEQRKTPPPTLFITGYGSIDQAVRLLNLGARDYITKPFDLDELLNKLRSLCPEIFSNRESQSQEPVLGVSPIIRIVQDTLMRVAKHDASVLITGESGVGKEHAARYLYQNSDHEQKRPFIAINCAAMPENLLQAELFGYEKGAFTGSERRHHGVFERANGGTLFLDEIGETSTAMQAKLLRTIQEGTVQRIGSEETIQVNVRLIFATNHDLKKAVKDGRFREDLYFRINVIHIHLPPLRERRDDILWFARRFVEDYTREHGVRRYLAPISERYLTEQLWPGNVRELRHAIDRACILARQEMLGPAELGLSASEEAESPNPQARDLKTYLRDCERRLIADTLEAHQWRIAETATSLGISRKNLWEKMRKHGIHPQQ